MIFINAFELAYLTKEIYFLIFIMKYKFIQRVLMFTFSQESFIIYVKIAPLRLDTGINWSFKVGGQIFILA